MAFTVRVIIQKFSGISDSTFDTHIAGIEDSELDELVITHINGNDFGDGYVAVQGRVKKNDKEKCYAYMHYRIQTTLASTEILSDYVQYITMY